MSCGDNWSINRTRLVTHGNYAVAIYEHTYSFILGTKTTGYVNKIYKYTTCVFEIKADHNTILHILAVGQTVLAVGAERIQATVLTGTYLWRDSLEPLPIRSL